MHPSEAEIIPYRASPVPLARSVVVFAPHPDDEIFGCGGAIALHAAAKHPVHIILLTAGDHGAVTPNAIAASYAQTRLSESAQAAASLGVQAPECWGYVDRGVVYGEDLVGRMMRTLDELDADVVYAPSPWELHPDHRAVAMAALEAVRRSSHERTLLLYEVSAPLRPNTLVDVTPVWSLKQHAMAQFSSQEEKLPYASFISSLNRFRALTLYPAAEQAEAYEVYSAAELRTGGPLQIESERVRLLAQGIAISPNDMPLVSVIVRTMGRPTLARAIGSVVLQTYSHLQIVLVDAPGSGLVGKALEAGGRDVRVVSTGTRLGRAGAANAGLRGAEGRYLIFLDDDDWLYPDHIAKLVLALRKNPSVKAVHTAVECVDEAGQILGEAFDFPYAAGELRYGNFMPIHSVLFDRDLIESGCAFDERFDLYEDWDFWLQVESKTAFGFVGGVSAAYRIHPGAGDGVQADRLRADAATAALYAKWNVLQSSQTFDELVTRALSRRSVLRQLDHQFKESQRLTAESQRLSIELTAQHQKTLDALRLSDRARQDAHHMREAHDLACTARDMVQKERELVLVEVAAIREQWQRECVIRAESDSLAAQRALDIEQLHHELKLSRDHSDHLERSLDASRHEVSALLDSTSWRVSRPVRAAGRVLRNLRGAIAVLQVARSRQLGWGDLLRRTVGVYRREGFAGVRQRARRMLHPTPSQSAAVADAPARPPADRSYAHWVARYDTLGVDELASLRSRAANCIRKPLVSLVMPVYNPQAEDLLRAIASVQAQVYPHWELCICDDASTNADTRSLLESAALAEPRIRLAFHAKNQHISHATNTAIGLAEGTYVGFLDHDDELRPHALLSVVEVFEANPRLRVMYSDEDKIDQEGVRFDPYFKPDFNLGLLRSHNYMCHFAVYQRDFLLQTGGLRPGFEGAQDYDLALRAVDSLERDAVGHVASVLYHWRTAVGSTASGHGNKSYAFEAGRRALAEHLERRGVAGAIEEAPEAAGMYRVKWERPSPPPLVSIIIPTRNGEKILRQCLDSLIQTHYPNYEVIVVDNGSDEPAALELLEQREASGQIRVLRDNSPFNFSALNNGAVRDAARGEFVLLMNNDIEAMHPEWLDEMVGPAMEVGVGCVGARLWYPDGRLQHAGVILVCGVAGHAHKLLNRGQHGYMGRAVLAQDFVAVTAACLLVRKSIYEEVHGLDESLAVAFNDVDFCLRVHRAGYRNHWTPYAELVHHESVSRGYEDTPEKQRRFKGEVEILQARWPDMLGHDPCYNPNLNPDAEDFSLAWPPQVR